MSEDGESRLGLSFVVLGDIEMPDPYKIMSAARSMGIELCPAPSDDPVGDPESPDVLSFTVGDDERLMVMLMPVPHPDVAEMAQGPMSPEDMDELIEAPAHLIVTVTRLEGTVDEMDIQMSALTASVLAGCNALGVLKMPGVLFHRPELFEECARTGIKSGELPMLICVDISVARETETQISFLTHNMQRYGRENFYVLAEEDGSGAMDYIMSLTSWMLNDRDYHLPTGDTVGRTPDEKIVVERVPNPTGEGPDVIRLILP